MDAIALPAKWQEWKIVETIGEGSFGTVYKAEKDDGVVRSVSAIKVVEIAASEGRMAAMLRRFQTEDAVRRYLWDIVDHCAEEIRTMYRLQGESNAVSIQDHLIEEMDGQTGWRLFIRMEYLQSFNDYMTTHEFTQRDIIRLGVSLCGALEKCEKLNILHRDIKPENIFVSSSGEFKLGDFGISRVLEETRVSLTSEGTFGYMAPEVYKGQACGHQSDIYSLGLVLYTLANKNCEPFIDPEKQIVGYNDLQRAFERRMTGEALPPPRDADPTLTKVLLKACAYRPSARYHSALEFRAALEPLMRQKRRVQWGRWLILSAILLALAAGGILLLRTHSTSEDTQAFQVAGVDFQIPKRFSETSNTGDGVVEFRAPSEEGGPAVIRFYPAVAWDAGQDAFEANAPTLIQYALGSIKRMDTIVPEDVQRIGAQAFHMVFTDSNGRLCDVAVVYNVGEEKLFIALLTLESDAANACLDDFQQMLLRAAGG